MTFNKHDYDNKQRFGIRKLSIGVCSVLLSTLFLTINEGQTVHADVQSDDGAHEETADSGAKKTGQPSQDLNVAEVLKQQKNPNYSFDVAKSVINYKITPAPATVTISNSASRDYTGQTTS
ncbi:YSIRK-type signal peptide-containing protein, partial [Lactobacillus kefiranofaciens]